MAGLMKPHTQTNQTERQQWNWHMAIVSRGATQGQCQGEHDFHNVSFKMAMTAFMSSETSPPLALPRP
jgi:hypothetical protein